MTLPTQRRGRPDPFRRTLLLTGMGLALVGCAAGPDYVPPQTEVTDVWHTHVAAELSQAQPDLEAWWTALDDPVLTELIQRAQTSNKSLRIAVARIREARAIRGVQKADYFPQVEGQGSFARQQVSGNTPIGEVVGQGDAPPPVNLWNTGFDMSWELDLFGRVRRSVEAASAEIEASIEDYRDVLVTLYADVALNYVEVRALQARRAYALANVDTQTESLGQTQSRFDAGLTSALDVAQAEANLASTRSLIPSLEVALAAGLNRLAVLLGEPPGSVHEMLEAGGEIPVPPLALTVGLPAELLRRRPDIRRAERQLAAQTARIGVAKSELYPRFGLPGSLGWQASEIDDLFSGSSLTWNLLPSFRWNIFSAGKIRNRVRAEEARTEQALHFYEQSILLALEEVENTMIAYYQERVRRERLSEAVGAAQRSVDLVRTQYLAGLTNFQNVLDSERTLFNRQDELAESEGRVTQNLIALNKALGGGWSLEAPNPDRAEVSHSSDKTESTTASTESAPAAETAPEPTDG